jgi:hypothetical protein
MFSSVLLFALASYLTPTAIITTPVSWHNDYTSALDRAVRDKKPVAIIVGTGPKGWQEITKKSEISKEAHDLLDEHFVCVYLDASTERGKKMADALNVGSGPALIIGDRSGTNQAFRYKGSLTNDELSSTLKRFSKVSDVATLTEFDVAGSAPQAPRQQTYYPNYFSPSPFGSGCIGGH